MKGYKFLLLSERDPHGLTGPEITSVLLMLMAS
jgi:hypothetical protein